MGAAEDARQAAGIDRQLDELYGRLQRPNPHIPQYLFHFTDPQGLLGIVEGNSLWASNADFLNDSSEPSYAWSVLKAFLDEFSFSLPSGSAAKTAMNGFWDWAMNMHKAQGPHVYVFCLSEHDDLLSQWRGYGAQGAGYAVGFSGPRLAELLQAGQGNYLIKVVYDESQQKQEAKDVFEEMVSIIDKAEKTHGPISNTSGGDNTASIVDRLRWAVLSEIIRLRAKFKTPAFGEESEWRVVQFVHPRASNPAIHFRVGVEVVKPYLELELGKDKLPIEQVRIGPTLDPTLARQSLDLLFAKREHKNVTIIESTVPYRR